MKNELDSIISVAMVLQIDKYAKAIRIGLKSRRSKHNILGITTTVQEIEVMDLIMN